MIPGRRERAEPGVKRHLRNSSGSLATLAAIRRASSLHNPGGNAFVDAYAGTMLPRSNRATHHRFGTRTMP